MYRKIKKKGSSIKSPMGRIRMAQITPEIMDAFRAGRIFPLATASRKGEPNVAPIGAVYLWDKETIRIGNQFMKTTIENVLENPGALSLCLGLEIKGCKGNVQVRIKGQE